MVHVTRLLSNFPKPLERLIAELGEQPASAGSTPRKKLVHKVSSAKPDRRSYKPNRKLTPEEVQKLVAQYEAGASIANLAREFGMHTQTVDAHLKRQGVRKHGVFKLSPEQVDEVAKLYCDGWSTIEIAKEFGVATNTVSRGLVRARVKLRSSVDGRWHTKCK